MAAACPCGSGRGLDDCCGPLLEGAPAPDALALMRSRYTASACEDAGHLMRTWHPSTRPDQIEFSGPRALRPVWLGLKVLGHAVTGDDTARVEFVARYRIGGGSVQKMHERSRFVREAGRWYYLDAIES